MKDNILFKLSVVIVILSGCAKASSPIYLDPTQRVADRTEDLLQRMTLEEKLGQMNLDWTGGHIDLTRAITTDGVTDKGAKDESANNYDRLLAEIRAGRVGVTRNITDWKDANRRQQAAAESRLKIPLFIVQNAVHSVGVDGTTIFPNNLAMAATFRPTLVAKIGEILARECRANGYNWTFSPTVDLARDARWGRCGETFGEDPLLVADMGVAMVKGLQGEDMTGTDKVASCLKHFVAGGQPLNGLNFSPAEYTERTLRTMFYPPFQAALEAGAWAVMPAHHDIGGVPCHASEELLSDVLRDEWGFEGVVVTDWQDMERLVTLHKVAPTLQEAFNMGINAGIDIHNNGREFIAPMKALVREGKISEARIDRAVRAILSAKFRLGLFENRYISAPDKETYTPKQELAYQTAVESMVLLKNQGKALPVSVGKYQRVLITGPYAHSYAVLGDWVRHTDPSDLVSHIDDEMSNRAPAGVEVNTVTVGEHYEIPQERIEEAARAAKNHDLVVLVVGGNDYRAKGFEHLRTGGENHARQEITPAGNQLELARALFETGTKVVVVLVNGRPLDISYLTENAVAVLETWNPGMQAGAAVADVLYGEVNPSGKLPISIPRSVGQVHVWYNHKPSTFFRKFQFGETGPLFSFGHGLSYTTFTYQDLQAPASFDKSDSVVNVSVTVTNTGPRAGAEVVLVYLTDKVSSVVTPVKKLVGYRKVFLEQGASQRVTLPIDRKHFELLDAQMNKVIEPGAFQINVGDQQVQINYEQNEASLSF